MYGILPVSFARQFHLAMSYWSFVLMGLHLGFHLPVMASRFGIKQGAVRITAVLSAIVAGAGWYLFAKNGIPGYIFFRNPFAFLDYDKPALLVFAENLAMLTAFAQLGACCGVLIKGGKNEDEDWRKSKRTAERHSVSR